MDNKMIGWMFIGIMVGMLLPSLPNPLDQFNPFLPFVFLVLAILLLLKN